MANGLCLVSVFLFVHFSNNQVATEKCNGREFSKTFSDIPLVNQKCMVYVISSIHQTDTEDNKVPCCVTPIMGIPKDANIMYYIYDHLVVEPQLKKVGHVSWTQPWPPYGKFRNTTDVQEKVGTNYKKLMQCAIEAFETVRDICPKRYTQQGLSALLYLRRVIHFLKLFVKQMTKEKVKTEADFVIMVKKKSQAGAYDRNNTFDGTNKDGKYYHDKDNGNYDHKLTKWG